MRTSSINCLIIICLYVVLESVLILKLIKKHTILSELLKINKKTFKFFLFLVQKTEFLECRYCKMKNLRCYFTENT